MDNSNSSNSAFTHVKDGQPTMVDITAKSANRRTAVASVRVELGREIIAKFQGNDIHGPKGPVFQTAIIAGTMAVKKTSELIPFCHPLPVENCAFDIEPDENGITILCEVSTTGKTGVEMEAMTGASIAALTVYDMCKAMNKAIRIDSLRLISKTGGKSGDYLAERPARKLHGLVLAGGHSSRMGTDKAQLLHPDGRTMVTRCQELLLEAGCEKVVVSLRHDQEVPAGVAMEDVVRDPEGESQGPMVGIISGMRLEPNADWLIVACDLPRLDVKTLTHLVSSKKEGEKFLAYRSESDALPEPLCALYAREALPVIARAVTDDLRCPRKVLIRNECRLLDPVTPRALDNANTPEDWETANAP